MVDMCNQLSDLLQAAVAPVAIAVAPLPTFPSLVACLRMAFTGLYQERQGCLLVR